MTGIVHLAALKSVAQSMTEPDLYMQVNYEATKSLIATAMTHEVNRFIFSSTAAVYGNPETRIIKESEETNPISPYGESKLLAEKYLNNFLSIPGNYGTSLRFFNVVGTAYRELMDNSCENLVPIVINALQQNQSPVIFGEDYQTPDGTCIRDYVDVRDIARAHLYIAEAQVLLSHALNIGTGSGSSVKDIIGLVCEELKLPFNSLIGERRSDDPDALIGNVELAKAELGFIAEFSLHESIKSLFVK